MATRPGLIGNQNAAGPHVKRGIAVVGKKSNAMASISKNAKFIGKAVSRMGPAGRVAGAAIGGAAVAASHVKSSKKTK